MYGSGMTNPWRTTLLREKVQAGDGLPGGYSEKPPKSLEVPDGLISVLFAKAQILPSRAGKEGSFLLDAAFVPLDFRLEEHASPLYCRLYGDPGEPDTYSLCITGGNAAK